MDEASERGLPSIPGYDVLEELGRGGMGVVYKARERANDRMVAVKLMRNGRGAHFLQLARFRLEAEAVACLAHPNIILIHDVGVHAGFPYLSIEYVAGGSLGKRIGKRPQPPRWAAQIAKTVAEALHHAHGRGILHRDLKPDNILLTEHDEPKVTDFGLAKFTKPVGETIAMNATYLVPAFDSELARLEQRFRECDPDDSGENETFREFVLKDAYSKATESGPIVPLSTDEVESFVAVAEAQAASGEPDGIHALGHLTRGDQMVGSPSYMAPEQAGSGLAGVGPATDVHAAGAVLYEMLTGHPPFQGDNVSEILRRVVAETPGEIESDVARDLKTICLTCLNKHPDRRYTNAGELASDLGRFLAGAAILAREEGLDSTRASRTAGQQSEARTTVRDAVPDESDGRRSWWRLWKS